MSRRVLVIGADHPGWATQLRYLSAELLRAPGAPTAGPGQIERVDIRIVPPASALTARLGGPYLVNYMYRVSGR